jgi:alkyl sulfatase BDS1-like metallo-beta-lactamase superfamily hydrolase
MELRSNGTVLKGFAGNALGPGIVASMTTELLLDLIGVRLNAPSAAAFTIEVNLDVLDGDQWTFGVRYGVLHARRNAQHPNADLTVRSSIAAFAEFAAGSRGLDDIMSREDFEVAGDVALLGELAGHLDVFDLGFEIVLP